jgi:hypothetical protein
MVSKIKRGRSRSIRPLYTARPVGGKPDHAALMYMFEHWDRGKVAGIVENILEIQDSPHLEGGMSFPIASPELAT